MIGVADGLGAALSLAFGRPVGLIRLLAPPAEPRLVAARSFWALAVALPGFLALHLMDWVALGRPSGAAVLLVQDLAGYVVGWLGFAVLSHRLASNIGREGLWPGFIAAWNWCSVVQYLLLVTAGLPRLLGWSGYISDVAWLVAMFWALWLEYVAARLTLVLSRMQAWAIVALDVALGLIVSEIISGVS